jgi:hypothetical protein
VKLFLPVAHLFWRWLRDPRCCVACPTHAILREVALLHTLEAVRPAPPLCNFIQSRDVFFSDPCTIYTD